MTTPKIEIRLNRLGQLFSSIFVMIFITAQNWENKNPYWSKKLFYFSPAQNWEILVKTEFVDS